MTTPVGQIGLSDVNAELGYSPTALISMNDTAVRNLAGVPSGAISMNDLRGKSNRVAISLTISSNTTNYDVYSSRGPTYNPGKSDITVTINPGVTVYSTSTGSAAFSVPSSFNPADTVTIVNNGVIVGKGGDGGAGFPSPQPAPGSSGGPGLYVQFPTTFQNNNRVAGGGGGGGGGAFGVNRESKDISYILGGGGGGGGVATGSGGPGGVGQQQPQGNGTPGSPGPLSAGGSGGSGGPAPTGLFSPGGPGGPGGGYGSSGSSGTSTPQSGNIGSGGASGAAVTGNPYITWSPTGTRNGPIS